MQLFAINPAAIMSAPRTLGLEPSSSSSSRLLSSAQVIFDLSICSFLFFSTLSLIQKFMADFELSSRFWSPS